MYEIAIIEMSFPEEKGILNNCKGML